MIPWMSPWSKASKGYPSFNPYYEGMPVAKYVTVGFKSEANAKKFMSWLKDNGNLLNLARRLPPKEGQERGPIQITNIQASSVHEYIPRVMEHRTYEFAPVLLEFNEQLMAEEFVQTVLRILQSERADVEDEELAAQLCAKLLTLINGGSVAGIKYQRVVGGI